MLRTDCLPDETRRLFDSLSKDPDIGRFILIGGTALALSWGHRRSEDLDFAIPALSLPRDACRGILERLGAAGWWVDDITDPLARMYQENEGSDLADTQQDWLCHFRDAEAGVKLTFFAEYMPVKRPPYERPHLKYGHTNVMDPDGLFYLKSQLLLRRTTLRDLFDVWSFLERGRSIEEVLSTAQAEDRYCSYERLRARLLPAKLPTTDPGLSSLIEEGPADFETLKSLIQQHLDAYEQRVAAEVLLEPQTSPSRRREP